ncbi:hypothetical protein E2C01_022417 [Portunus trituberculatus]|uniref:Uncharacterized protein n=1 Tax=Portunus trituberculatus TaxID=210409 RepID=A0A5B7E7M1_PORTR|nr:hypothetical protein [Portunus trituberculatus]
MTKWFCSSFQHIEVKQCIFLLLRLLRQPLQLPHLLPKRIMYIHIKHVDDKIVLFRVSPPSEVKQNIFLLLPRLRQPLLPIVGVRRHHVSSPEPPKLSYLLPCPFPSNLSAVCFGLKVSRYTDKKKVEPVACPVLVWVRDGVSQVWVLLLVQEFDGSRQCGGDCGMNEAVVRLGPGSIPAFLAKPLRPALSNHSRLSR